MRRPTCCTASRSLHHRSPAGLHLVATPIGNLRDITVRALEVLAAADLIACEDTRVTRRLLDHYGIATPLTPYHDHNAAEARPKLLARLAAGEAIALVSDAGTPLISDPGFKLVREAAAAGHAVTRYPGRLRGAGGARGRRTADRSLLLRRLSAGEGKPAAAPASPNSGAFPRRWCCSRADRALPPRSPISRPGSERARPRSAASSPSCTRRFGAADLAALARAYAQAPEPRGEIVIVIAPPGRAERRRDRRRRACCATRSIAASVKEAVAEIAAVTGSRAAKSISARWH